MHCCSWLLCSGHPGPAAQRAAFSTSALCREHLFPKPEPFQATADDRGLGHRCGNGVIRSNQASAQMAAGMREGHKTPSGSSAGVGSCQGSAPAPRPESAGQRGFLIWGFPMGISSNMPLQAFGERKRSHPSLSTTGCARRCFQHSGRVEKERKQVGQKTLICDLFFLCIPLPSSLSKTGEAWLRGGTGQM